MFATARLPDAASRRQAAIFAAVVGGHALVLAALALNTVEPPRGHAQPNPVFLDIEPRPLLRGERPRQPRVATPEPGARAGGVVSPLARAAARRPGEEDDLPPEIAAAADQGVDPLWRVRPETAGDRTAQAIRAAGFGCHPANRRLSAAEQASCDRRLAEAVGSTIPGTGDPERDRQLARQGAAAIARYEGRRAPLAGGTGVVGPADCVGSNLGMGCAGAHLDPEMRQDE